MSTTPLQRSPKDSSTDPISPYGTNGTSSSATSKDANNSDTAVVVIVDPKSNTRGPTLQELEEMDKSREQKKEDGNADGKKEKKKDDKEEEKPIAKWKSIIAIIIVHIVGALVILAGSQGSATVWSATKDGFPVFAVCGIIAFAVNWVAFIPAYILHTEKFYDLVGGVTHISVVVLGAILSWHTIDYRGIVAAVAVSMWAVRLAGFLFIRVAGSGAHDPRFDVIKFDFFQFLMTWSLQGLWITINTTAALALITTKRSPAESFSAVRVSGSEGGAENDTTHLDILAVIGFAIWFLGFIWESTADEQKRRFKNEPANKNKWCDVGVWSLSRYPNYFGEMTLWTGLAIAAIPVLFDYRWVMLISPVFCIFLLTCVSGIPLVAARLKKKHGDDPEFQHYWSTTPALIPGPPRCC